MPLAYIEEEEEEEDQPLHHPLIIPTATIAAAAGTVKRDTSSFVSLQDNFLNSGESPSSSDLGIIFRFVLVIFVGLLCLWANHEASKSFDITLVNEAGDTLAGKRFSLFYVSNDDGTRIIQKTSKFIENFLYPNETHSKKEVDRVILRLASRNLTHKVVVDSGEKTHEYVINLSPSILEEPEFAHDMLLSIRQGMARIWLWDGQQKAPASLINGMAEHVVSRLAGDYMSVAYPGGFESPESADIICWKAEDPRTVTQFLNYWEEHKAGFIRRLNQALQDGWNDRTVDIALGVPSQHLCDSYKYAKYNLSSS